MTSRTDPFWDKVARKYAQDPITNQQAYDYTCNRTREHLSQFSSGLEIGCGTGGTARLLANSLEHFVATDISAEMIAIAKERQAMEPTSAHVRFEVADALSSFDLLDQVDAVMAHNLLHLVDDVPAILAAAHSKIKPGGLLISKTVCLGQSGQGLGGVAIFVMIPMMRLFGSAPNIVKAFDVETLERWTTEAGFEIVEATNAPDGPRPNRYIVAKKV